MRVIFLFNTVRKKKKKKKANPGATVLVVNNVIAAKPVAQDGAGRTRGDGVSGWVLRVGGRHEQARPLGVRGGAARPSM